MDRQSLLSKSEKLSHDPTFTGMRPSHHRSCHDIPFCLLFLIALAAMVAISLFAFTNGQPRELIKITNENFAERDAKNAAKAYARDWFQDAVGRMSQQAPVVLGSTVLAIVLGFVWIQLLRWFTKAFIYITLFLGVSLVLFGAVVLYVVGHDKNQNAYIYASYALFAVAALLILAVIFLRSRINLTAVLMKETCQGVNHNAVSMFSLAVLVVVMFVAFSSYWVAQYVFLYSVPSGGEADNNKDFNSHVRYAMLYQVFIFFWVTSFLSAVYQMVVAGAISSWYFGRSAAAGELNAIQGHVPAVQAFFLAFTKSFGSLAFGSLILAIVKFINYLLEKAKRKSEHNKLAQYVICCLQCCVYCCQSFIEFVTKFAYIGIAMHGESFCTSAKTVASLVSRNAVSLIAVDMFGDFVIFVGKLFGTAASTALTLLILYHQKFPISGLTVVLVVIVSFVVFHLYAHIVGTGLDTVFVCYLEDLERNEESQRYFIEMETHQYIQNHASKKGSINNTA